MGFAGVSTRLAPCAVCLCTEEDWDDLVGLSPLEHSWQPFTLEAYEGFCWACERRVRLDAAAYSEVRGLLDNDNRPRGRKGRVLTANVPTLGLEAGDRLEPSPSCLARLFLMTCALRRVQ